MPKHSSHILEMARKGAEHRYAELKSELATLVKNFPHLAARTGAQVSRAASHAFARGRKAVAAVVAGEAPKKRRKMSAKARKAIGDAQRRRWAAQKAAAAASAKKSKTSKK